jgi:hypothetical protein
MPITAFAVIPPSFHYRLINNFIIIILINYLLWPITVVDCRSRVRSMFKAKFPVIITFKVDLGLSILLIHYQGHTSLLFTYLFLGVLRQDLAM